MDFFEAQDDARGRTKTLVILFLLAVICIVSAVYAAISAGIIGFHASQSDVYRSAPFWDPLRFVVVGVGTVVIIIAGSSVRAMQFGQGGGAVARALGGRRVDPTTRNPDERLLMNVIEEMSIASCTALPEVYILDEEEGINAFAAGFSPNEAAVAVTRGCLDHMSRDELQGIIAHEFSHILKGDMRLNIRLAGILYGILVIAIVGRIVFEMTARGSRHRSSSDSKGGGAVVIVILVGLAIMVIGYVGEFFGRLIQSAVSRQREFLADAAAVQFTRNPGGIGDALKKIGGFAKHSKLTSGQASGIAHFFFANALKSDVVSIMATHPPLEVRIRAIDPNFDGKYIRPKRMKPKKVVVEEEQSAAATGFGKFGVEPMALIAMIGQVQVDHVNEARRMLAEFSADRLSSLADQFIARAAILGLLLDPDEDIRRGQLTKINEAGEHAFAATVEQLAKEWQTAGTGMRIPIVEIAVPAIRQLAPEERRDFLSLLNVLVKYDLKLSLTEFCIRRIVRQRVDPDMPTGDRPIQPLTSATTPKVVVAARTILSALIHLMDIDPEEKTGALDDAVSSSTLLYQRVKLAGADDIAPELLDSALDILLATPFGVRKQFLQACAKVVVHDGEITDREAELLRAVSIGIDCPMPPVLPS